MMDIGTVIGYTAGAVVGVFMLYKIYQMVTKKSSGSGGISDRNRGGTPKSQR